MPKVTELDALREATHADATNKITRAVRQAFALFDTDGSGYLSYEEFEAALLQKPRPHPPPKISKKADEFLVQDGDEDFE